MKALLRSCLGALEELLTPYAAAAYAETDATLAGEYATRQEELERKYAAEKLLAEALATRQEELERKYAAEKLLAEALENRVASLNASLVAEQVMSKAR